MSLVIVGSVAYDAIETPHGKVDRILGGAATYIALAASYFTSARVVAVVGNDFAPEDVAFLESRGVGLEGLERVSGKSFFWSGIYSADMNERTTLATELNVFADFDPKIPVAYRDAPYLLLGNIQPGLQRAVRAQMPRLELSGGDTMNYWISGFREELVATIAEWDFLLINDSEARMLSGQHNLLKAAESIIAMGPHTLVIKRGEYGALLFRHGSRFMVPGYLLENVFDPTGAGDCFAGGFAGYLASEGFSLRGKSDSNGSAADIDNAALRRAVVYGSVMGSFCCEKFGPDRFRTLTRAEVDRRFQEFSASTRF